MSIWKVPTGRQALLAANVGGCVEGSASGGSAIAAGRQCRWLRLRGARQAGPLLLLAANVGGCD